MPVGDDIRCIKEIIDCIDGKVTDTSDVDGGSTLTFNIVESKRPPHEDDDVVMQSG